LASVLLPKHRSKYAKNMNKQMCPFVVGCDSAGAKVKCNQNAVAVTEGYQVNCSTCKGCTISQALVRAPSSLLNWDEALGVVRELRASTNGKTLLRVVNRERSFQHLTKTATGLLLTRFLRR